VAIYLACSSGKIPVRPLNVRCRDVSRIGIGLSHTRPLNVGTEFAIVMHEPERAVMRYVVNRCFANTRGCYDIGANLQQVLRQGNQPPEPGPDDPSPETSPSERFMRGLLRYAA